MSVPPHANDSTMDDLIRYALFSRLAYFDYDITTDDLCVLGHDQCFDKVHFIDKPDTQLWVFEDNTREELVIAFRGSDSMGDLLVNLCITPQDFVIPGHGTCHGGHMKCYKAVRNDVMFHVTNYVQRGGHTVTVCGHSLGGTCACIAALEIALLTQLKVRCYSYGALAFADPMFNTSFKTHVPHSYRIAHKEDFAPAMPMILYKHDDTAHSCVYIDSGPKRQNNPLARLHAMHYIRHHSIESYIAGLRQLSKRTVTPHNKLKPYKGKVRATVVSKSPVFNHDHVCRYPARPRAMFHATP